MCSSQPTHFVMQVAAGSTSSFCTCTGGMLFGWGKLKSSGDNWRALSSQLIPCLNLLHRPPITAYICG